MRLYEAVFRNRAKEVGLAEHATEAAVTLNIGTLGQFGFSTAYIPGPGQQDETPLRQLAKELHGHGDQAAVTIGEMTAVRRLYLEAGFGTESNKLMLFISTLLFNLRLNIKFCLCT